ncbi:MAG: CbtA family protein [Nitrosopumilaceae archaeon]|jgi:predicted cobalt transporter CbtA|uniref:CbtA family protein n=2 Tax=Candidatus Nitrosomaritimum aestuariumsis TaxID=3342354 RepID=A0AC60VZ47_9ARCH|nr:CbtA family protein [Nitrosopumilaceae archaeon]MBA4459852.1 CbtA family protein [Nitrosopumilaceae archaeon]MBA4462118.1 CbtA family protein [Nitrosopumilaceae archaeon]MBA4462819.1 CbtA family protein [Nitrosopumilaceae archaeon]
MRTSLFVIIVLVSGAFAGFVHGSSNLVLVEPYLDEAINIENQNLFASGEEEDTLEFLVEYEGYREWQKGGQLLAGVVLGTSIGALFGIVFALSRNSLPGNNDVKKSLVLAGIMWVTIYFIPFLKYPANPPTVGDAETVVLRGVLYLSFIAISGFAAVGFYKLSKIFEGKKKLIGLVGYAALITAVFIAMPDNPDEVTAPPDLVEGFRIMSVLGVTSFWITIGFVLGLLWRKFNPNKEVPSFN